MNKPFGLIGAPQFVANKNLVLPDNLQILAIYLEYVEFMTRYTIITLAIILILVIGCQNKSAITIAGQAVDPTALELGDTVYSENCAACHGVELEGQPDWQQPNDNGTFRGPPHDETGHTWHHDDAYLLERIRTGPATLPEDMRDKSPMPAYENSLSEEEILAVLLYIKSTWPEDIQTAQADR